LEDARWNRVRSFHKLNEAKETVIWIAEEIEMDKKGWLEGSLEMEGIEKIMLNMGGRFWTRQDEMIEEVESLGYKVNELDCDFLIVFDLQDGDYLIVIDLQDEIEHILHVGRANETMWIESAE